MLIKALCDYYDINKSGDGDEHGDFFSTQPVHYSIFLTPDGEISGIVDIRDYPTEGKKKPLPKEIVLPKRSQKTGIDLNIIEHRPLYIFGLNYDKATGEFTPNDKTNKAKKSNETFVLGNLDFCEGIDSEIASAFRNFLTSWKPEEQTENPHLLNIAKDYDKCYYQFALDGRPTVTLHTDPELKSRFIAHQKTLVSEREDEIKAICPIEGELLPVARIHEKIKGIRGGNTVGGVLVGVKDSAFESYGKTQSYNSGISEIAMKKYTSTLNALLSDRTHVMYLEELTLVYFGMGKDDKDECDYFSYMLQGDENTQINSSLHSIAEQMRQGQTGDLSALNFKEDSVFYVVGLTPNSSRISQKFIIRNSFGKIMTNIINHQNDLAVKADARQIPVWKIFKQLILPKSTKDTVPPPLVTAIFMSVFNGTPYPTALLETVVRRIKTDSDDEKSSFIKLNDIRIGMIKAYLNRKARYSQKEEEIKMALDENNTNQAYLCGRLFAVLELVQQRASGGGLNRTIKDSYFSSACARPAVVFPKLVMLAQNHLSKIENKRFFIQKIGDITAMLTGAFPQTLPLEEQGKFIIGYYQQNNDLYTKKPETQNKEEAL